MKGGHRACNCGHDDHEDERRQGAQHQWESDPHRELPGQHLGMMSLSDSGFRPDLTDEGLARNSEAMCRDHKSDQWSECWSEVESGVVQCHRHGCAGIDIDAQIGKGRAKTQGSDVGEHREGLMK